MPWNGQGGGGPWGSPPGGGRSPWGQPSGGGFGQKPPDFDDLWRRYQDRVRRVLPGGFGMRGGVLVLVLALIAWGLTGVYRVQSDERGVVLRFGRYVRTTDPGLNYRLPVPIETVLRPQVERVNRIEVGFRTGGADSRRGGDRDIPDESLMLTGDENIIDIDFVIFWKIADPRNFLFRVRDPEGTIRRVAESAMREVIGRTDIQPALTDARQDIELQARRLLQATLNEYETGVEITQLQLLKVDPPAPVVDAFNDVQRARSDRERARNEAETYRNDILPRARGEAERILQEAAGYREQVVSLAQGDARRFSQILDAYRLAPDVTAQRMYLETMEQVMRGTNKLIIDPAGGSPGVVPYLPMPDLLRRGNPTSPPVAAQPPLRR